MAGTRKNPATSGAKRNLKFDEMDGDSTPGNGKQKNKMGKAGKGKATKRGINSPRKTGK